MIAFACFVQYTFLTHLKCFTVYIFSEFAVRFQHLIYIIQWKKKNASKLKQHKQRYLNVLLCYLHNFPQVWHFQQMANRNNWQHKTPTNQLTCFENNAFDTISVQRIKGFYWLWNKIISNLRVVFSKPSVIQLTAWTLISLITVAITQWLNRRKLE